MTRNIFLFAIIISLLASCSPSTKILSAWAKEDMAPKSYSKLMVLVVTPNMEARSTIEDAMAKKMKEYGIKANVSFFDYPFAGRGEELKSLAKDSAAVAGMKQHIREKISKDGVDAIFMISAYDIQKSEVYHEGSSLTVAAPAYGYYGGYYGYNHNYMGSYYDYYAYSVGTVHSPGYYSTSTTYYLQSNLFDVASEKMIYTVQTKTVDYVNLEREADLFSKLIVNDIAEKKVLECAAPAK